MIEQSADDGKLQRNPNADTAAWTLLAVHISLAGKLLCHSTAKQRQHGPWLRWVTDKGRLHLKGQPCNTASREFWIKRDCFPDQAKSSAHFDEELHVSGRRNKVSWLEDNFGLGELPHQLVVEQRMMYPGKNDAEAVYMTR